jgi:hypothetical protein
LPGKTRAGPDGTLVAYMAVSMKTTLQAERQMNTSIINYPGFQTLPKGAKQMLLASEAYFFDQPVSHHQEQKSAARGMPSNCGWTSFALLLRPVRGIVAA